MPSRYRYLSAVSFPMTGAIVPGGGCADRCVQERGWKHGVVRVRVCGQKKSHNSDEAWFRVEVSVSRSRLIIMKNGPITTSDKPTADFRNHQIHVSQFRQFSQFGGQHTCTRKKQIEAARVRKQWKGAFNITAGAD